MKLLLAIPCFLLFWTTFANASLTIDFVGRDNISANYDIYNHNWINENWVAWEGFASGGGATDFWTVESDQGSLGQVWVEVLFESDLAWEIANYNNLQNLFFTASYDITYILGRNDSFQSTHVNGGPLVLSGNSGVVSFAYKQSIPVTIGESFYVSDILAQLNTPIISADPWTGDEPHHNYSATSGAGIFLSLDSRITYLLPNESPAPVPEPSSALLLGLGLIGLAGLRRKKKSAAV